MMQRSFYRDRYSWLAHLSFAVYNVIVYCIQVVTKVNHKQVSANPSDLVSGVNSVNFKFKYLCEEGYPMKQSP